MYIRGQWTGKSKRWKRRKEIFGEKVKEMGDKKGSKGD